VSGAPISLTPIGTWGGVSVGTDGSILIGGSVTFQAFNTFKNGTPDNDSRLDPKYVTLARLTPQGGLDGSFDGDGIRYFEVNPVTAGAGGKDGMSADHIRQAANGDITVIGATINETVIVAPQTNVVKLNAAGGLLSSYDGDGIATFDLTRNRSTFFADALDRTDGSTIILARGLTGSAESGFGFPVTLTRLLPDGKLDPAFNGTGVYQPNIGREPNAITSDAQGRFLIGGNNGSSGASTVFFTRRRDGWPTVTRWLSYSVSGTCGDASHTLFIRLLLAGASESLSTHTFTRGNVVTAGAGVSGFGRKKPRSQRRVVYPGAAPITPWLVL